MRPRGTTTTPSRSPTTTSLEATVTPPQTIGKPTEPGPRRCGEFGVTPIAKIGRPDRFEVVEVAHKAVGHEAGGAAVARDADQEVPRHGRPYIASGRDHEYVARPAFGERRHERQIVERATVAGERHADERAADEPLDPPVEGAGAVHGVDDEARGRASETLDELARWPLLRCGEDERGRFLDHDGP